MSNCPLLAEAFQKVTVLDVARRLNIDLKVGLQKSPFRDDDKPSFSVFKGGMFFKDHAGDQHGGAWKFLELAAPNMPKADMRKLMLELAGLEDRPATRASRSLARSASKRKMYEDRDAQLRPSPYSPPEPWPQLVEDQWNIGCEMLSEEVLKRFAESRGWSLEVMQFLAKRRMISFPWLPWADGAQKHSRRGMAFLVEAPVHTGSGADLVPVGYHQRFMIKDQKAWIFVPYVPAVDKRDTVFQQQLAAVERSCSPFPFVLGCLDAPELLIVTEGQFDAISIAAAAGWFCPDPDKQYPPTPPAAVVGLRGSKSVDVFLGAYAPLIRRFRPVVWLIHDNDAAGLSWIKPADPMPGKLPVPTFSERLKSLGVRVVTSFLRSNYGKDFNDFYRWRDPKPGPDFMADWMDCLKLDGRRYVNKV